jgi:murein DD-endopeptidase
MADGVGRAEGFWKRSAKALIRGTILAPLLALHGPSPGQQSPSREQRGPVTYGTLQIDTDVRPTPLQFVLADDGNRYLGYTLLVGNWGGEDLRFSRVDVEDAASGRVLISYNAAALENPYRQRNTQLIMRAASPENRILPAGRTALLMIAVRLEPGGVAPAAIRHRILFEEDPRVRLKRDDGSLSQELVSMSPSLPVDGSAPIVLGAPLRGGPWRCGNGFGLTSDHHYIAASGTARFRVAQRFGCDFGKVDPEGNILPNPFPDEITASMFYAYGEEVLAVADARVVKVRDGIPEGVPQIDGSVRMPVPNTEDTGPGNRVVLDLGRGRYAFYAHFQPGSIRVKPGQRVREGQVLGKVGMAGNASNPHLHFHVGNGPSLNGSDGIAYVFRNYVLSGRGRPGGADFQARQIVRAVPLQMSIMTFPDKRRPGRR